MQRACPGRGFMAASAAPGPAGAAARRRSPGPPAAADRTGRTAVRAVTAPVANGPESQTFSRIFAAFPDRPRR